MLCLVRVPGEAGCFAGCALALSQSSRVPEFLKAEQMSSALLDKAGI